jgi:hypothetical protein
VVFVGTTGFLSPSLFFYLPLCFLGNTNKKEEEGGQREAGEKEGSDKEHDERKRAAREFFAAQQVQSASERKEGLEMSKREPR